MEPSTVSVATGRSLQSVWDIYTAVGMDNPGDQFDLWGIHPAGNLADRNPLLQQKCSRVGGMDLGTIPCSDAVRHKVGLDDVPHLLALHVGIRADLENAWGG